MTEIWKILPLSTAHIATAIHRLLGDDAKQQFHEQLLTLDLKNSDKAKLVEWKFLLWLQSDEEVQPGINHPDVSEAIAEACRDVLRPKSRGEAVPEYIARSAERQCNYVATTWEDESAVWSAESAAWSVASAINSDLGYESAAAIGAAGAVTKATTSAGSSAANLMAKKLIELLEEAV